MLEMRTWGGNELTLEVLIQQAITSGDNSAIEAEVDKVIATGDVEQIQEMGAKLAESGIEEYTLAGTKDVEELWVLMTGQNMGAFSSPIAYWDDDALILNDADFSYNMMSCEEGADDDDVGMFEESNITSFTSDLPSLTHGYGMFSGCNLDLASVQNIARTINTYNGKLTLGLGCTESDFNDHSTGWYDAVEAIKNKGWTIEVALND